MQSEQGAEVEEEQLPRRPISWEEGAEGHGPSGQPGEPFSWASHLPCSAAAAILS